MKAEAAIGRAQTTAPPGAQDRVLCGWRVRSALPLPEVAPWNGDDRPPDITIRLGSAPPLDNPVAKGRGPIQVGHDGTCRLTIDEVASFLVVAGRDVIVEPRMRIDAPDLREWLLGVVLGMLCHQRALLPLHASCVRIGGGAIAFAGHTGVGKSTMAAAIARRGHGLIADDVCAIDFASSGAPQVRPSFPRVRLWEDAMRALDVSTDDALRASGGKRKFHFCPLGGFDPAPIPLRVVYRLERVDDATRGIERVSGANAAAMLCNETYRPWMGFRLGRRSDLLTKALRAAAHVPVFRCPVACDLAGIAAAAVGVEAHVRSMLPAGGP
jgi:hypothetical protein